MARETDQEERDRHDKEKADAITARQIRLGDIPDPSVEAEEDAPKTKSRSRAAKPKT